MDLVWYVAYGSNMYATRLGCYLAGGRPAGGSRTYLGCRDPRPPRQTAPVMLPGGIYFALESATWTGGVAFYDEELPGRAAARAYLITRSQFADILAQEMYEPPGTDRYELIAEAVDTGRARLGPGCYETLICAGSRDGRPLLTFTAPWRAADVPWNPPAPAYLRMIAGGLHEAHGWSVEAIVAYLGDRPGIADRPRSTGRPESAEHAGIADRPGIAGQWSTTALTAVVTEWVPAARGWPTEVVPVRAAGSGVCGQPV